MPKAAPKASGHDNRIGRAGPQHADLVRKPCSPRRSHRCSDVDS